MYHITFDMDDTLTATHAFIRNNLVPTTQEIAEEMEECDRNGLAYVLASEALQDDIYNQILEPERFMLETAVATWVQNHIDEFRELIQELRDLGHTFSICTHRGWSDTGFSNTISWLRENDLDLFKNVHCLNSEEYPCKLAYLEKIYGKRFVIVDDNPYHGVNRQKELDYHGNVLQCVGEHLVDNYVHFTRFSSFPEFKDFLYEKLGMLNEPI
ncbi:hypothetical protein [Vibrio phage VP4B]|uniref:Uncharacterized protein n=1 Tax=Vibrio phage VP4B TaxID=1262540 RepID=V9LZL5_9CAUD|nr:hypothetical protein FDJ61_gp170 [Vibrio phage VP4B]AGB07284.1 hypothetical protein [Vibrio phage VP4B]